MSCRSCLLRCSCRSIHSSSRLPSSRFHSNSGWSSLTPDWTRGSRSGLAVGSSSGWNSGSDSKVDLGMSAQKPTQRRAGKDREQRFFSSGILHTFNRELLRASAVVSPEGEIQSCWKAVVIALTTGVSPSCSILNASFKKGEYHAGKRDSGTCAGRCA